MKTLKLNETVDIPVLGFGTWKLTGDVCSKNVAEALKIGYRHIDTADMYGNHSDVVKGIKLSAIKRQELFLTTKLPASDLSKNTILANCERYLTELETDYLDLLLIHWPNREYKIEETLEAMNSLKEAGKIRAIGVSNFTKHHLEDCFATGIEITNNQVELHPTFNQQELVTFCQSKNITVTAYSPVGRGDDIVNDVIIQIADKYFATPAEVCLAWERQHNIVAIPKSSDSDHIRQNFESLNLNLSEDDMKTIDQLSQGPRIVAGSTWADWDY